MRYQLTMAKTGHQEFLKVLARAPTDRVDRQELQVSLVDAHGPCPFAVRMDLEKLTALDVVQHAFTRGGIGGGHLVPRFVWSLTQMNSVVITASPLPEKPSWRQRGLHLGMALAHARRNATTSECNRRYKQIERILALNPYELPRSAITFANERPHILNNKIHFKSFFRDTRHFTVRLSSRLAKQISEDLWQAHAWHDVTRTVLAIKRWRKEHGQYPETLDQLVGSGSLEPLPLDPYSDTTLIYRRTVDDFVLYSRGRNLKDDGGVSEINPKTPWEIWGTGEAGDAVFWPVQ
ncbi:MAG: hypothetical protein ACYTAS_21860 [Planctomycetota bacterium]|jgi:hypothetical protein